MNNKENDPNYDPSQEIDPFFRPQEGMDPFAIYNLIRGTIVREFRKLPDPSLAVPSDTWNIVEISKIQRGNHYKIRMEDGGVEWEMLPNKAIRKAQGTIHKFHINGTAMDIFRKVVNYISNRTIKINCLCFKGTPPVTEMIQPFQPNILSIWMNSGPIPVDLCFSFVDESKINYVAIRDDRTNLESYFESFGSYLSSTKLAKFEVTLLLKVINYKALNKLKSNFISVEMEETSQLDVNAYVGLAKVLLTERPIGFRLDIGKFDNLQESFTNILSIDGWTLKRYLNTDCATCDGPNSKAIVFIDEKNLKLAITAKDFGCPSD
ncbi:hypothetical protein CAEBREN_13628 [Caenorhabditis brenneri]|uniref:Uncharacterized protein n=1 Tax=Caenorhabditis brenneri TaxID=135651 RepID=G0N5A7_CAEBE|nr:hypothetical protein CAEBREN_13628 [Caenorhabditis brenneri]